MKKFYSINTLCRLTLVSVRALHHYDEMDLLKPNHRTEKGHRRYSENDLMRLQQIVTLKFLGFSLAEIKQILDQENFSILNSLKMQEKALIDQMELLKKITRLLNYLIGQHEMQQPIEWETVIKLIGILKHNEIDHAAWHKKYLSEPEQKQFDTQRFTHKDKWQAIFNEIKSNITSDPEGKNDLYMINKILNLANTYYGQQPEMIPKLWEAFKAGLIPSQLPADKDVVAYITRAFAKLQNNPQ